MSEEISMEVNVYSPRWGHDDTYTITMSQDRMEIKHHPRSAICKWVENKVPVWKSTDRSLFNIFRNDSIYAPENFLRALEYAWIDWRSDELDDSRVNAEIQELFDWLNTVTKAKPETDYWKGKF